MTLLTLALPDVRTLAAALRAKLCLEPVGFSPTRSAFAAPSPKCARPLRWRTGVSALPPANWSSSGTTPTLKTHKDRRFPDWPGPACCSVFT